MSKTTLEDLATITVGYAFKSDEFVEPPEGTRLLRCDNIGHGSLQWAGARAWLPQSSEIVDTYSLEVGDVVLAMDRPWIASGLKRATVRASDLPSLLVQRVARLRAKPGVEQGFLRALIESRSFTDHILAVQTGTTIPHVSGRQILSYSVADLPPIAKQRAIAGVLGALDDKIESNRRLSKLAQDYARTELEYACSDIVRVVPVGELVRSVQERTKSVDPDGLYVGLEHFTGFDLSLWRCGRAADTKSASKTCSHGDLLFGRIRPYFGNVCLAPGDAVVAQSVEVLRATKLEDREATFLRLSSQEFIDRATLLSSGTTMPQVKWHDLLNEQIVMPSDSRSVEFHKRVAPYFEVIARAPGEVETLTALRDALLPELLSGRLRVKDAEKVVEGAV